MLNRGQNSTKERVNMKNGRKANQPEAMDMIEETNYHQEEMEQDKDEPNNKEMRKRDQKI